MRSCTTKFRNKSDQRFCVAVFVLLYLLVCLIITLPVVCQRCRKTCSVLEDKSKSNRPCEFPFKYKNRTFRKCTDFKDDEKRFWCSTKVNSQGVHIGGQGFWGYCDKTVYPETCTTLDNLQTFIEDNVGATDFCGDDKLTPKDVSTFAGRAECPCREISECGWTDMLQSGTENLPKRHRLRRKVIQLIRDSVCNFVQKTVHCCEGDETRKQLLLGSKKIASAIPEKQEDSGLWKPDPERGECGQDLNLRFIVCDDPDECLATRNEFPYMALLGYDVLNNGKIYYTCGGSVINKKYVLTAAHCHNERKYTERIREVILGEYVVGENPDCEGSSCSPPIQKFGVKKVISHEKWDNSRLGFKKGYDIALVRLTRPATLFTDDSIASAISPICLPWKAGDPNAGTIRPGSKLTVTGWGRVTNNNQESRENYLKYTVATRTLQKAELPMSIPGTTVDDNCKARNRTIQFCAGGQRGVDSCSGDSGGPAAFRESQGGPWYQLGIVSFGSSRCGSVGRPGVYTKLDTFLPWIEKNLEP